MSSNLFKDAIAVGCGAAAGGALRFCAYELAPATRSRPWITLGVNVLGSFCLGALAVSTSVSPRTKLLLGTGLCGGFTTMSTFSVEFLQMIQAREALRATVYFTSTNASCVGAAIAGMQVVKRVVK